MISKSQLDLLSKWAKGGRLIVRPILGDAVPEWAKHEFRLARLCAALMRDGMRWRDEQAVKAAKRQVSRETLSSVLAKIEAKSRVKPKNYRDGAIKAAATRKRMAAARAVAAEVNVGEAA